MGARCRQWESLVSIRIVGLSVYELLSVLLFDGSSGPLSRESSAKVRRIYETTKKVTNFLSAIVPMAILAAGRCSRYTRAAAADSGDDHPNKFHKDNEF